MVEEVLTYADRHGMLPDEEAPLVLMVSGGSDSTALCLACHLMVDRGIIGRDQVTVLHVNHGLRGEDSDNDALFVERLARLCGFRFSCVSIDIAARQADFGNNMESTARYLRYEEAHALLEAENARLGAEPGAGRIWTAHTRDDRVETFYMRSIVGTGPGGFASIVARNGDVARPLLACGRQELRDFVVATVSALGWELDPPHLAQVPGGYWREDHTNYETDGFRAFVRNRLVPVAEERNPALGRTLTRSMDLIEEESAFLDDLADELACGAITRMGTLEADNGLEIMLDLGHTGNIHPVLLRRLIHRLCKEILPLDERIATVHIERMVAGVGQEGLAVDLPGGAQMLRTRDGIEFLSARAVAIREREAAQRQAGRLDVASLPIPGSVEFGGMRLAATMIEGDPSLGNATYIRRHSGKTCAYADLGRLESALTGAACESAIPKEGLSGLLCLEVSRWREGDVVCPLGMGGAHKKLSDVFTDRKVERVAREEAIVVRAGSTIVWVVGMAVDERFKAGESGTMVRIEVEAVTSDVVG